MKFLEISELSMLVSMLSGVQGDLKIDSIIECYSCKACSSDKDLYNSLDKELPNRINFSPNGTSPSAPFGSLTNKKNRNIFIYLIATLSSVYSDFNFSKMKDTSFKKIENYSNAVNLIDTEFMGSIKDYSEIRNKMWSEINKVIDIPHSTIYSYIPGEYSDDDPLAQSCLWGFNYFFYNDKEKKVLFFHSKAEVDSDSSDGMNDSNDDQQQFEFDI
eukprot:TRINITY_DN804_c0_g1_i1.p1 TRINITY_DN804_c0_g1~~TRINITY_DN804_c0_g1_i1.p1  ORF type:complete len:216 (-),score=38.00 TRINITY_DN804_c0_g1_i1:165-812(-)